MSLVVHVVFWPFGGFLAALVIIGIALLTVLVALYAASVALTPRS